VEIILIDLLQIYISTFESGDVFKSCEFSVVLALFLSFVFLSSYLLIGCLDYSFSVGSEFSGSMEFEVL